MRKIDMNDPRVVAELARAAGVTLGQVRNAILMAGPGDKSVREYLQVLVCEKAKAKLSRPVSSVSSRLT